MAEYLAQKWKELIQEMGGINAGGKIIHYSHSLGGIDSLAAKELLFPEEAAMVEIHAFASPKAIPSDGFGYAITYCSTQDNVWFFRPHRLSHPQHSFSQIRRRLYV